MFHSGHQTGLHVLGMNEGTPPNFKGLQGIGHRGKIDQKRGEKIHKVKGPGHKRPQVQYGQQPERSLKTKNTIIL